MKLLIFSFAPFALCAGWLDAATQPGRVVIKPEDTGAVLSNPGMGWILEYYGDALHSEERAPSDTLAEFPGLSVVDFRVPWAHLEPEEGRWKPDRFLDAAANRYAGNPDLAFVGVGTFGAAGSGTVLADHAPPYTAAIAQKHIDLQARHFPGTPLVSDSRIFARAGGEATLNEAASKRMGLDLASVPGRPISTSIPADFSDRNLVVLGTDREHWLDGREYTPAVEDSHASYISVGWWIRDYLAGKRELIDRINARLGYRLQLLEVSWPEDAKVSSEIALRCQRRKPGAAEVRAQQSVSAVPSIVKPGVYDVFISVGTPTGTPRIALPLPKDDGQRRYWLGSLTVLEN